MISEEINLWIVILGVAVGIYILILVVFLAIRYRKFKKSHSEKLIRDRLGKYEKFDGIFLPLTEINHYRYYYRY